MGIVNGVIVASKCATISGGRWSAATALTRAREGTTEQALREIRAWQDIENAEAKAFSPTSTARCVASASSLDAAVVRVQGRALHQPCCVHEWSGEWCAHE